MKERVNDYRRRSERTNERTNEQQTALTVLTLCPFFVHFADVRSFVGSTFFLSVFLSSALLCACVRESVCVACGRCCSVVLLFCCSVVLCVVVVLCALVVSLFTCSPVHTRSLSRRLLLLSFLCTARTALRCVAVCCVSALLMCIALRWIRWFDRSKSSSQSFSVECRSGWKGGTQVLAACSGE